MAVRQADRRAPEDDRRQRSDQSKRRDREQGAEKTAEKVDECRRADQDRDGDETEHVRAGGASEQEHERQCEKERRWKQERRRIKNLLCPCAIHRSVNETVKGSEADDRCDCCCEREGSEAPHVSYSETFRTNAREERVRRLERAGQTSSPSRSSSVSRRRIRRAFPSPTRTAAGRGRTL